MMRRTLALALVLPLAAAFVGCAEQTPSSDARATDATRTEAATPAAFEMTEALESKLAAADRVDGTEDKVVSRCPGCGLAMPGSDEHTLAVGDYSLHFCSESCKGHFEKDVPEAVMALAVPEE